MEERVRIVSGADHIVIDHHYIYVDGHYPGGACSGIPAIGEFIFFKMIIELIASFTDFTDYYCIDVGTADTMQSRRTI